jgi:DNA (cytosine-5)-methyltransferase 1
MSSLRRLDSATGRVDSGPAPTSRWRRNPAVPAARRSLFRFAHGVWGSDSATRRAAPAQRHAHRSPGAPETTIGEVHQPTPPHFYHHEPKLGTAGFGLFFHQYLTFKKPMWQHCRISNSADKYHQTVSGMIKRPIAIDLFSGAGGLSLGFEQAGFDIVAAVEIDPVHAAIHKYNFPDCTVIPRSIDRIDAQLIREQSRIGSKDIDIVIGGPPCQGFSLIGQRILDDPRNALVREFVRIVKELSPRFFLFENVKGLTIGKHRRILDELVTEFKIVGYNIRLPWKVLNAANYGVPQDRERLFLIGARADTSIPQYPAPSTVPVTRSKNLSFLATTPSCRDAIGDLPDAESFEELSGDDSVATDKWGAPSAYAAEMRCMHTDAWHYGYRREWDPSLLTSSARTAHTDLSRRRFASTRPGDTEPISRFFKLEGDGISNTLRAGTDSARGAFTSPRPIHYERNRCITVREMARLHGFPDWFRFHKTKWHGARQIGNAVPPPLARHIAAELIHALGHEPTPPSETVRLGDPVLLAMDMTAAAEYWGIEVPIAGRKSSLERRRVHCRTI